MLFGGTQGLCDFFRLCDNVRGDIVGIDGYYFYVLILGCLCEFLCELFITRIDNQ